MTFSHSEELNVSSKSYIRHTPPVSPKILSRSGGDKMSLPTTEPLNPGAYCSTQSNAIEKDTSSSNLLNICILEKNVNKFQGQFKIWGKK